MATTASTDRLPPIQTPPGASGRFITFEGIEACGKSTQIQLLSQHFQAHGVEPLLLREPGGTAIGEKIRSLLKDSTYQGIMKDETELLLMNAARAQIVREVIQPALASGKTVICDRYYHSTLAYQGYGRGLPLESLRHIIDYAIGEVEPDIVFFLDIPLEISWQRIRKRNQELRAQGQSVADRFEESGESFFKRVYEGFQALASSDSRFQRINANQSPEAVARDIWSALS